MMPARLRDVDCLDQSSNAAGSPDDEGSVGVKWISDLQVRA
jgi:hypothetical protein